MTDTNRRINNLQRRVSSGDSPRVVVTWEDPENSNLLTVNGEIMSRPEFEARYPGPYKDITWDENDI